MQDAILRPGIFRPEAAVEVALIRTNLKIKMHQDPAPYLDMKKHGATAAEVYRKARGDGYKNHECLVLIMGVFGLELDEARKIGHQFFYQERDMPGRADL